MIHHKTTHLPGLRGMSPDERRETIARITGGLGKDDADAISTGGLSVADADCLVENAIGMYSLPLGVATNFRIDGRDIPIPMVTEEPSVIAAASSGAKIAGDVSTRTLTGPRVIGQIQILDPDGGALDEVKRRQDEIVAMAQHVLSEKMQISHVTCTHLASDMLKVEISIKPGQAMGANAANRVCEYVSPLIEEITGGRALLRILSNHMQGYMVQAEAVFDVPQDVAQKITDAYRFAALDKYRTVTHNKGVMNGITSVAVATGQDTRAIEAGAHACADGPMTRYEVINGALHGSLAVQLSVGTVGGLTTRHPTATACMRILGNPSSAELARIMAAVGLCQNFAALRALVTDGIQKGHMKLHNRRVNSMQ